MNESYDFGTGWFEVGTDFVLLLVAPCIHSLSLNSILSPKNFRT